MNPEQMASLLGVELAPGAHAGTWALLDKSDPTRDRKTGEILRDGKPKPHLANVQIILENDPKWRDVLVFCELSRRVLVNDERLTDSIEADIVLRLSRTYGIVPPVTTVHDALVWAASAHPRHPVHEWLDTLEWDGVERLGRWLTTYCAAEDTSLTRAMGRAWMIQAVARAMQPGCKADAVLILKGVQGCRKSTTCAVLGGEFYKDSDIDLGSKDKYAALEGAWIYELAELDAMRKSDARALKAFVSSSIDSYRPAYARNSVDVPRTAVFIGTTNDSEFLVDATGSRRFLVVEVGQCDPEALEADRAQLWAEALEAYRRGEQWHLDAEHDALRAEQAEQYEITDSWDAPISAWLRDQRGTVTLNEVWTGALANERVNASKGDDMRMGKILRAHGWDKARELLHGRRVTLWRRVT